MSRPKGSKNKVEEEKKVDSDENQQHKEEKKSPEDTFISTFEAAERLNTVEPTIKVWVDHGILRGENGRVSVRSIRLCRFNSRRMI